MDVCHWLSSIITHHTTDLTECKSKIMYLVMAVMHKREGETDNCYEVAVRDSSLW